MKNLMSHREIQVKTVQSGAVFMPCVLKDM